MEGDDKMEALMLRKNVDVVFLKVSASRQEEKGKTYFVLSDEVRRDVSEQQMEGEKTNQKGFKAIACSTWRSVKCTWMKLWSTWQGCVDVMLTKLVEGQVDVEVTWKK